MTSVVSKIIFLHGTHFPLAPFFEEVDRDFAEAEMRAFFSALHKLPSVMCFNGLDAVQWFSRPGLEYFAPSEVEVTRVGGQYWLPFRGVHRSALVDLPESTFPVVRLNSDAVRSVPFIFGKRLDGIPLPTNTSSRLSALGMDFGWLLLTDENLLISVSPTFDHHPTVQSCMINLNTAFSHNFF